MSDNTNRILKADAARGLGATILFNYDDLKHRCRLYVEQVRQRAGQMIADARAESEAIRQRAFEEAKTAGLREAMQQVESDIETRAACLAEQKVAEQLETLLPAMRQASDELTREYDRWLADWEESAARLCVDIAEKLIKHELDVKPESATNMITEALRLAVGQPRITVRLNPMDLDRLGNDAEEFVKSVTSCGEVILRADDLIDRGGCQIETKHGEIDARLQTLLERITAELIA